MSWSSMTGVAGPQTAGPAHVTSFASYPGAHKRNKQAHKKHYRTENLRGGHRNDGTPVRTAGV